MIMKQRTFQSLATIIFLFALTFVLASCSTDSDDETYFQNGTTGGGDIVETNTGDDGLENFSVELNTAALSETESIPTDTTDDSYEDYVENVQNDDPFKNNFTITFTNDDVTIEGYDESDTDFLFYKEGAKLTVTAQKKAHYILKGTSDNGAFKITGAEKKAWVELAGLTLKNQTGAAIQKQSDKRLYLTVASGTTNTLCDGENYTMEGDEQQKGTIFTEGKLIINGMGTLNVKAIGTDKNAIVSDDYLRIRKNTNINITATTKNGIKTNDAILIDGGVLNVSIGSTAGKGLSTDGYMEVSGGRTTIITTGDGTYADGETTACACIKTDSIFRMTGGELWLKSTGQGGKGISCDQELFLEGGKVRVITTGTRYTYGNSSTRPGDMGGSASSANRTSAKGIKADKAIYVSGGDIAVRSSGGEGSEGIESKTAVYISGGTVQASCYDDCINASSGIVISGGNVYAYSSTNDGIDSNGPLTISGGVVLASGSTAPEEGIDCDQNTFTLTGGIVVGVGGATSTPATNTSTQPSIIYGGSGSQGTLVTLVGSTGEHILSYTLPRTYSQMTMLVSSPQLSTGNTYYFYIGSTLTGTTTFHGLQTEGSVSVGSSLASATLSSPITTVGTVSGGMGGGGNMTPGGGNMGPGGRW